MGPLDDYDIEAVRQGGCASGAYMPAVTYCIAAECMYKFGHEIVEYLDQQGYGTECEFLQLNPQEDTYAGWCVKVVSAAVEEWCYCADLCEDDDDDAEY
jgi:hypothetical protein